MIDTNLTGYFLVAREVVPRMLAAGGGRIVNISVSDAIMHRAGFVPYGPSRAGSEALSRIMAADLRDTGVTVNLLLPGGPTVTGMMPRDADPGDRVFLEPAVMGAPIVWLASVIVGCVAGLVLLVGFIVRALRARHPVIDLRHFSRRGFATAATLQFLGVGVMTGAMLLLPLYFIIARGETELVSGLLLAPQGIGAAIAMKFTGKLVDRGHGRSVVVAGLLVMVAGLFGYTTVGDGASLAVLMPSLFGIGVGAGCIFAPTSAAAYAALDRAAIAKATTTLSILQRSGGAIATAIFATVLQTQLTGTSDPAGAFAVTFWWPFALVVIAIIPAILLPAPAPKEEAA